MAALFYTPGIAQQTPLSQDTENKGQEKNNPVTNECRHTGDQPHQIWSQIAKYRRRQQYQPLHEKRCKTQVDPADVDQTGVCQDQHEYQQLRHQNQEQDTLSVTKIRKEKILFGFFCQKRARL